MRGGVEGGRREGRDRAGGKGEGKGRKAEGNGGEIPPPTLISIKVGAYGTSHRADQIRPPDRPADGPSPPKT